MIRLRENGAAVVVLGFEPADPGRYGRLIVHDGALEKSLNLRTLPNGKRRCVYAIPA